MPYMFVWENGRINRKNSNHVSIDATQNPNIIIYAIHSLCSMNVIDV